MLSMVKHSGHYSLKLQETPWKLLGNSLETLGIQFSYREILLKNVDIAGKLLESFFKLQFLF